MRRVKQVEQPEALSTGLAEMLRALRRPRELWSTIRDYVGMGRSRRRQPIVDRDGLKRFLETRASHVAQTSLYGYVRTRAGMRYPELFHDDGFIGSINVAKWQMWLACLSDLAVFAGGLLTRDRPEVAARAGAIVHAAVSQILAETGTPSDAGPAFPDTARAVLARIEACDWTTVSDDGEAFVESPPALVRWAPIVDELKQVDEPIVLNSVRFRWQEIRRNLRDLLDPAAVLRDAEAATGEPGDSLARPSTAG
ncbi:MAG: hypothetical protein RLO51_23290 [Thalassobaculum sp.]|uniref:hypothetical protein n=1 Tax=Thalassobaculum sp. TaxID=2022740 RepID=UPI0032ED9C22